MDLCIDSYDPVLLSLLRNTPWTKIFLPFTFQIWLLKLFLNGMSLYSIPFLIQRLSKRSLIQISNNSQPKYIWTPSCSGRFSTSSAYLSIIASNASIPASPDSCSFWKSIWKLNLNDRVKLFLWKIAWNIIPTKARLNAIFISSWSDDLCPLCKVDIDSLQHLFFNCTFAHIV